ncbi:MAG: pyrroline-5-carboxylate reductase [Phycisphaerales bacterium]|nr:pyrroline-5-carboxylate reductase [Phycisphaerales bacterium]MDP6889713.1 pyrroline-5-carboxylate reductase [Phycisphaerales bacterium]
MTVEIGFLGAGHMGLAIIKGGLSAGLWPPESVIVADSDAARRAAAGSLGCEAVSGSESLRAAPIVVLCVRPQDFPAAAAGLAGSEPRLVISIMAGIESAIIGGSCGEAARVIRAMPNAPAAIGRGMTAIAKGVGATDGDFEAARRLFSGIGRTVAVSEGMMCAVTAVSGSGPAWVYLLAEAIRSEAVSLGLPDRTSDTLVRGMVEGAAAMLGGSELTPAELREAVTTPGGTTEAGLAAMREAGLVEAVRAGVAAACRRGEELSQ